MAAVDELGQRAAVRIELEALAVRPRERAERAPFVNDKFVGLLGSERYCKSQSGEQTKAKCDHVKPLPRCRGPKIVPPTEWIVHDLLTRRMMFIVSVTMAAVV